MPVLIFIWGNLESDIAWNLSDLALGSCTWVNMLIVLLLSPKVIALYKDYEEQMKAKKESILRIRIKSHGPELIKRCGKISIRNILRMINKS